MKTAQELRNAWSSVKSLRIPKVDKVPKVLEIRGGVREIELAACRSMSFPFSEVEDGRDLLVDMDAWLKSAGHPQENGS